MTKNIDKMNGPELRTHIRILKEQIDLAKENLCKIELADNDAPILVQLPKNDEFSRQQEYEYNLSQFEAQGFFYKKKPNDRFQTQCNHPPVQEFTIHERIAEALSETLTIDIEAAMIVVELIRDKGIAVMLRAANPDGLVRLRAIPGVILR